MEYKVDFDALDSLYNTIGMQSNQWLEELEGTKGVFQHLVEYSEMSGTAADSIKAYISAIHFPIINALSQLIMSHANNFLQYKADYQTNIDTDLHARIHASELEAYRSEIEASQKKAVDLDESMDYVLNGIKDIFSVSYPNIWQVESTHEDALRFLSDLNNKIEELESKHYNADFSATRDLLANTKVLIEEQMSYGRSYRTGFSVTSLSSSTALFGMYQAYVKVKEEQNDKTVSIQNAMEHEKERAVALQAEYEERQKIADMINIGVTAFCIVASVAVIIASAGTATPLVMGGVSAATSALMAGTQNLTAQYVEHGNVVEHADEIDWKSFGQDVFVAGATGFITGTIGSAIGNGVTKLASKTPLKIALESSNWGSRLGSNAGVTCVSEIMSGMATRGTETFLLTGGDVSEALKDTVDPSGIAHDAAVGSISGAVGEVEVDINGKDVDVSLKKVPAHARENDISFVDFVSPTKDNIMKSTENLEETKEKTPVFKPVYVN